MQQKEWRKINPSERKEEIPLGLWRGGTTHKKWEARKRGQRRAWSLGLEEKPTEERGLG